MKDQDGNEIPWDLVVLDFPEEVFKDLTLQELVNITKIHWYTNEEVTVMLVPYSELEKIDLALSETDPIDAGITPDTELFYVAPPFRNFNDEGFFID